MESDIFNFLCERPDRPCILSARDLCDLVFKACQMVLAESDRKLPTRVEQSEDDLLTPEKVMSMCGISRSTLTRLTKAGNLIPIWVGGQRRFSRQELKKYLNR